MNPNEILESVFAKATTNCDVMLAEGIRKKIDYVSLCTSNRAGVRLLMACMLGKLHRPNVDPRNPYTEIEGSNNFSGRTYDEQYITQFITRHRLPVNPTTAFLTPTLRNINQPLTVDRPLVGRPRDLYIKTLEILDEVANGVVSAEAVFIETVRVLLKMRDEKLARMESLINSLERGEGALPLPSEAIVNLIAQHLACKNSSRLPVLIVAAAYKAVGVKLGENVLPLNGHNAADFQTGSFGDVEICLVGENDVVTAYEMKMKRVTIDDIDVAITKIVRSKTKINNYLFVTTDVIKQNVTDYCADIYENLDGTEIAIIDCIGFLRHFLHFFHRSRSSYLENYQSLVLAEPDSAVSQTLKEAFLALRQSAESVD